MTSMPQHVELPEAFLSVTGLGAPVDYFPRSRSNKLTAPIMAALLIIGSILSCGWGLDAGYSGYLRYGAAVVYDMTSPPLIIAVVLLVIGIILIGNSIANRSKAVVVYEKGLAYQDRRGIQTVRWEEVAEFYLSVTRHMSYGIQTGTTFLYTIKKNGGGKLVFDNRYANVQHLGGLIGRNILPLQYQLAADIYNSGQTASFGPIAVSRAGLVVAKKTYPWNEIEQVSVQQGFFRVSKKGGGWFSSASTPVSSIPNLEAMLSIIDQVAGVRVG